MRCLTGKMPFYTPKSQLFENESKEIDSPSPMIETDLWGKKAGCLSRGPHHVTAHDRAEDLGNSYAAIFILMVL